MRTSETQILSNGLTIKRVGQNVIDMECLADDDLRCMAVFTPSCGSRFDESGYSGGNAGGHPCLASWCFVADLTDGSRTAR